MKIKYVVFDCWDTVVKLQEVYPRASIKVVYDHVINKDVLSFEELAKIDEEFLTDYYMHTLYDVNQEALIAYLCESNGLTLDCTYAQAAKESVLAFKAPLLENFKDFISFLKQNGIKCSVLSNSVQSKEDTEMLINRNFDESPFENILASSFYAVKKPDVRFFNLVAKKAGVENEAIAFIGDNIYTDIIGSYKANMQPFYFNWKNKPAPENLLDKSKYTEFTSYLELIEIFKERI